MSAPGRLFAALVCALLLVACDDDETTVIPGGTDCFLIYSDLRIDWVVDFAGNIATNVTGCDDSGASDGAPIGVSTNPVTYAEVVVNASDQSASFQVLGDLGAFAPTGNELIAAVEADTCLALFQVWEDDDSAYLHCIGTLDLNARLILASCDSASLDLDLDGVTDATCAIPRIDVAVTIVP